MKEELLVKIKEDLANEKKRLEEETERNKRIKILMSDRNVIEFLNLTGLKYDVGSTRKKATNDIIESMYYKYLHQIKESETNGIYVYMGTYRYSDEIDIIHGSYDVRVPYDSIDADYRLYRNIEKTCKEKVLIRNCALFENTNTIINRKVAFDDTNFYEIQKDFFIRSIKDSQEAAKRMILRKYSR